MRSEPPFGERLLAEVGTPRRVRLLDSSPRSHVWQAEVSGTRVVVKQLVDAPEADERYARETAGLSLAGRAEPPLVPKLLGVDPERRLLVLEHVEHRRPGEDWVVGYATALARLHAVAVGPDSDAAPVLPAWSGPTGADADAFLRLAHALGVEEPGGVRGELDDLVDRLGRGGGRSLLHGDPCPGNDLHTAEGVRFIDFEQAALGDGIVELAYLRVGFPTCWCATRPPRPLLDAAEAAYRTAWREATGTEAGGGLADACAGWLLRGDALVERALRGRADHFARVVDGDWRWGTATARQRLVHRLGVVSAMAEDAAALRAFGQLAAALRERLPAVWPRTRPLPARGR
ncbi:aminoglycoside phosphotransferase family protein [Actinacidiphila yeochonensis]|uniref:aminoglycoside phosphotransferase family protein n=1 Tax=Actinacidiphila yeochonensis TaxID=89050 RepID=UPI00055B4F18|nr:aminoglycoside phosphotransferase family protein [Actinacidiphila yeochonensis]